MAAIRRLLVANRGEIARRVIRTAHEMGIETIAVYAEGDADAPFVREAGTALALRGRTATETYLNVPAILAAARASRADAVHPGYGFLSENAAFASAVRSEAMTFVGPPSHVIEALGDKLAAKKAMATAGVPVLESVEMAPGCPSPDGLAHLGYPALIKAASGGGGKGMRIVREAAEVADALASASREALAAFGDERVFAEPYLERSRHVEIQIFGDSHGNLVHCFERECSIQRRHQKIIEESPSTAVTPELREQMGDAALRAARAAGYENAGTVEFLLGDDGRFFFLEVNTRLQVEHLVTEAVTGLDLVREQLLVAEGAPLSFAQGDLELSGHAIEARLYAEDPAAGYLPQAGRVEVWREATEPRVRYDSGVESGSVVGIEFDPMLAKVISHAPTRREAAARLALALERTSVDGLTTNREFLAAVLRDEAFLAGDTPTTFLEERSITGSLGAGPAQVATAAIVAALSGEQRTRADARVLGSLPSGWTLSVMPPQGRSFRAGGDEIAVRYRRLRDGRYDVSVSRTSEPDLVSEHSVRRHGGSSTEPALEIDGVRLRVRVNEAAAKVWVDFESGQSVELAALARFPEPEPAAASGALVAPMPGAVLSVHVTVGDDVTAGQLLVVVEAMKMEHRITAPVAGRVREVQAATGAQVSSGDLLVALDPAGEAGGA